MGKWDPAAAKPLVKLHIKQVDLEINPAPEFILHQLVTNIKGSSLVNLAKITSLMKSNGRKYLEGMLFLNQG